MGTFPVFPLRGMLAAIGEIGEYLSNRHQESIQKVEAVSSFMGVEFLDLQVALISVVGGLVIRPPIS